MAESGKIIDGKEISRIIFDELRTEVAEMTTNGNKPGLAVVILGENPASKVYAKNKKIACDGLGIYSEEHALIDMATEDELIKVIEMLNDKPNIHGILIQRPMPKQIDEKKIAEIISADKDVDAFHLINLGGVMTDDSKFLPCTPAGVMELLKYSNIEISGKHCVIVGRSNIVGKPMAMMMLHKNATVTITHSKTTNLKEMTKQADILIVAIGKEKFITADMVKAGAVVIDVGMNRTAQGKLCGDVDFDEVQKVASFITPVPGGVGPMTITMLMKNTVEATKK